MGGNQTSWRLVAPRFEDTHRVVLFDHVGCDGQRSTDFDSARHESLEGYADDVIELLGALDLEGVTFVGHSMSGSIGAIVAARSPRLIDRLVLIAATPRFLDDPPVYRGGFTEGEITGLLELFESNFLGWAHAIASAASPDDRIAEEIERNLGALDRRFARSLAAVALCSDARAWLPRVSVPAMVVQCTRDSLVPVSVGEYIASTIPHATLRLLDAAGHAPQISHSRHVEGFVREALSLSEPPL